jgi:hypothetical protein
MIRVGIPVLALVGAATTAVLLGFLVHDALGVPRGIIRIDALASASLIGFALASNALLKRNK